MSGMTVKFSGFKGLDRAINKLPAELKDKAYRSVLSTGARVIAKNAKKKVPRDEGLLRKSIGIKAIIKTETPFAVIGSKRGVTGEKDGKQVSAVTYARNVEQGTAHTAAQPFMRPAIDESGNEVFTKMTKGLSRFMARAVNKVKTTGKF